MAEKIIWIPRNLNDEDIIKIGFGIKFKLKDLPFLATGTFIGYQLSKLILTPPPYGFLIKVIIIGACVTISYLFVRGKLHGQEFPEIACNRILYTARRNQYKKVWGKKK